MTVKEKRLRRYAPIRVAGINGTGARLPVECPAGFDWIAWPTSMEYAVPHSVECRVGSRFVVYINNDNGLVRNQPYHVPRHKQADVLE